MITPLCCIPVHWAPCGTQLWLHTYRISCSTFRSYATVNCFDDVPLNWTGAAESTATAAAPTTAAFRAQLPTSFTSLPISFHLYLLPYTHTHILSILLSSSVNWVTAPFCWGSWMCVGRGNCRVGRPWPCIWAADGCYPVICQALSVPPQSSTATAEADRSRLMCLPGSAVAAAGGGRGGKGGGGRWWDVMMSAGQ